MAGESGSGFDDCEEDSLESLSNMFQVEHLSECANSNLFDYPVMNFFFIFCQMNKDLFIFSNY
jgi:hypothetical protein